MRVLFLIPGGESAQLDALPAAAAVARQLNAQVQVACPSGVISVWKLLPEVEKAIPFSFEATASLADWANLLGTVREPDFQACINLATGWPTNLMLSLSHIPNRVASSGFACTSLIEANEGLWPPQALGAYLLPLGIQLDASLFRLRLPRAALDAADRSLPPGEGPLLVMARSTGSCGWPAALYEGLLGRLRHKLPNLRVHEVRDHGGPINRAAMIAGADLVLSESPSATDLALYNGVPLVALGAGATAMPRREDVHALGLHQDPAGVGVEEVLQALGMG